MKWKHTLAISASLLLVSSLVLAVVPTRTVGIQMPSATDMGRCPPGPQAINCIDNNGETPTWHYQDGGTATMTGGGGGSGTVTSVGTGTGLSGGPITTTGTISLASQVPYASGSPAKGDVYAYTGSAWVRVGVGDNGECLQAASGETSGLAWGSCGSGGGTIGGSIASGQLACGSGSDTISGSSALTCSAGTLTLDNSGAGAVHGGGQLRLAEDASEGSFLDLASGGAHLFGSGSGVIEVADLTIDTPGGAIYYSGGVCTITGEVAVVHDSIGTATTPGVSLVNSTAATSGNQQYSPAITQCGRGWKTDATAASQEACIVMDAEPVQGTANPSVEYVFYDQINGGSKREMARLRWNTSTQDRAALVLGGATNRALVLSQNGTGLVSSGAALTQQMLFANSVTYAWNLNGYTPGADATFANGATNLRWKGTFSTFHDTAIGSQITAATSITPTSGKQHITGATSIATIAVTNLAGNPRFCAIADDGTITFTTGGNIATGTTIAEDHTGCFEYDSTATLWYPAN